MEQMERDHTGRHGVPDTRAIQNLPTNMAPLMSAEEEIMADVDEPPDERTPRPNIKLPTSLSNTFSKTTPHCDPKKSLLTSALSSAGNSPTEEHSEASGLKRGMSSASTWSNNSTASTAELTSDGFTSPGTRTSTPSPPLPPSSFHRMVPIFNKKPFQEPVSIVRHDDENVDPVQKAPKSISNESAVEANLGRKRCITFACGRKDTPKEAAKTVPETTKPKVSIEAPAEPPKRQCMIKFACPSKISTDAPSKDIKPRIVRPASPAPSAYRSRASPKASPKAHRGSDSTVRNGSPVSVRKVRNHSRRLSGNSDLAKCEAFRFHEFASSEEEVDEWVQESTCHRSRLTINDTLKVENGLRQLGEEVEEEALEDEEDEELADEDDDEEDDLDDEDQDEDAEDEDEDEQDDYDEISDEGFQTDDEEGFAGSDDESDAGSDYQWWAPGASTAATSVEHLEHIRPSTRRSVSESSVGSMESAPRFMQTGDKPKRKKSRPVNIRVPSPELPDSTDFVCGTLDEDRPLEDAYLSCLERRRAAKHKVTPQDIDPTFPTSDPEMDEEDEDDEPDQAASESDQHFMMHGQMEPHEESELRGRRKDVLKKRSPAQSPKRLRSPPPMKRVVHRSPPPRKLFGHSPKRLRSPPPPTRLRSPPPTRRGSYAISPKRPETLAHFAGLAERPPVTVSSSLPRTPISAHPTDLEDDDDTCGELPVRRAIDIKLGLESKRQRRKEQLYKKLHRKNGKDKEKRPPPGKGAERMREMGLGLAAHKGKNTSLAFAITPTPDQKDLHILSL